MSDAKPAAESSGKRSDPIAKQIPVTDALEKLRRGIDTKASQQLIYETYFPVLIRFLRQRMLRFGLQTRVIGQSDLTQDVLITLLNKLAHDQDGTYADLTNRDDLKKVIHKMAHRVVKDAFVKHKRPRARRIAEILSSFEKDWVFTTHADDHPDLFVYLRRALPSEYGLVLQNLLLIELDHRRSRGEVPTEEEYNARLMHSGILTSPSDTRCEHALSLIAKRNDSLVKRLRNAFSLNLRLRPIIGEAYIDGESSLPRYDDGTTASLDQCAVAPASYHTAADHLEELLPLVALTRRERLVFDLWRHHNSTKVVAELLGKSQRQIQQLLRRALTKLRGTTLFQ